MTFVSGRYIVFWQGIVSPHMAFLAKELVAMGYNVAYIVGAVMSEERAAMGWQAPSIPEVRLEFVENVTQVETLLNTFPEDTIHIVQGIRGKGHIGKILSILKQRNLRWGAVIETIKENFLTSPAKRFVYSRGLVSPGKRPDFLLAIGEKTPKWLANRGFPSSGIYSFSYFLDDFQKKLLPIKPHESKYCIGFVGRLDENKRVDLLFEAIRELPPDMVKLKIVGGGPLETRLKKLAWEIIREVEVEWLGRLSMAQAREIIQTLDCLVLPSRHDGWGAVITESLMVGVPVICSDGCGASEAVRASGIGGVFPSDDLSIFCTLLRQLYAKGRLSQEACLDLATWARGFSAAFGANYLVQILQSVYCQAPRPIPPWIR